jgi:hypothetical protein
MGFDMTTPSQFATQLLEMFEQAARTSDGLYLNADDVHLFVAALPEFIEAVRVLERVAENAIEETERRQRRSAALIAERAMQQAIADRLDGNISNIVAFPLCARAPASLDHPSGGDAA